MFSLWALSMTLVDAVWFCKIQQIPLLLYAVGKVQFQELLLRMNSLLICSCSIKPTIPVKFRSVIMVWLKIFPHPVHFTFLIPYSKILSPALFCSVLFCSWFFRQMWTAGVRPRLMIGEHQLTRQNKWGGRGRNKWPLKEKPGGRAGGDGGGGVSECWGDWEERQSCNTFTSNMKEGTRV